MNYDFIPRLIAGWLARVSKPFSAFEHLILSTLPKVMQGLGITQNNSHGA